jgi:uncharacterized membrane protein SirB2
MFHRATQMGIRQIREEAAALGSRLGLAGGSAARAWAIHALALAVFGVLLPYRKGVEFFDPLILGAYTCLGSVFAAPAAATGAGDFTESALARANARILVCALYGELMVLLMTAGGITTVYARPRGALFPPAVDQLLEFAGLGLILTLAATTFSVWLSLRFSAAIAKLLLRFVFLAALAWFFLRGRTIFGGFVWQFYWPALAGLLLVWAVLRWTLRHAGAAGEGTP